MSWCSILYQPVCPSHLKRKHFTTHGGMLKNHPLICSTLEPIVLANQSCWRSRVPNSLCTIFSKDSFHWTGNEYLVLFRVGKGEGGRKSNAPRLNHTVASTSWPLGSQWYIRVMRTFHGLAKRVTGAPTGIRLCDCRPEPFLSDVRVWGLYLVIDWLSFYYKHRCVCLWFSFHEFHVFHRSMPYRII